MTSCCDSRSISCARSASTSPLPTASRIRSQSRVRHHALGMERLDRQQLDAQPELQLAPLSEELAQLRQGVSVDHHARIARPPLTRATGATSIGP